MISKFLSLINYTLPHYFSNLHVLKHVCVSNTKSKYKEIDQSCTHENKDLMRFDNVPKE